MSSSTRKYQKQKRKRFQFKYVLMVLVGLAVIVGAGFSLRGTASGADVPGGKPAASVDQKLIDYGHLKDFTVKTISIKLTNTGNSTLRFTENPYIEVVQGCCPPDLTAGKMALKPGQSTTITSTDFMMHPGMDGKHDFAVHIKTNDPSQPDLVVHVLSDWSE